MAEGNEQQNEQQAAPAEQQSEPAPMSAEEIRQSLAGYGDIQVEISAVLGTASMPIEQFLKLSRGAIVELNQKKDQFLRICANNHQFATGEVVVMDDRIGVNVKEITKQKKIS